MIKCKNFLRLVGLEFVRLFRNKAVIILLLLFASIITIFLSFIRVDDVTKSFNIAVYTENKDLSEISAVEILEENFNKDNFIIVNSVEEGVNLVKKNKAVFFLEVNSETTPETIVFHYDGFSNASLIIKEELNNQKNEYSYNTITEFLDKYGITINRSYFESINFKSINNSQEWGAVSLYVFGVAAGISVVMMFGLAYSVSRDSETNANKIVSFMPITSTKFMWSKILTYLIIGVFEMFLLLLAGVLFYNMDFQMNWLLIVSLSSMFVLSSIMLGMAFSLLKGQVLTVLCSVSVILIPLIILSNNIISGIILPIRILLYMMPMTPFIELFHGMVFNGVVNWINIIILLIQVVIYYMIAYLLLRRNAKNN